jgi:hypothetical protein
VGSRLEFVSLPPVGFGVLLRPFCSRSSFLVSGLAAAACVMFACRAATLRSGSFLWLGASISEPSHDSQLLLSSLFFPISVFIFLVWLSFLVPIGCPRVQIFVPASLRALPGSISSLELILVSISVVSFLCLWKCPRRNWRVLVYVMTEYS